jgi:hypothetical protein
MLTQTKVVISEKSDQNSEVMNLKYSANMTILNLVRIPFAYHSIFGCVKTGVTQQKPKR